MKQGCADHYETHAGHATRNGVKIGSNRGDPFTIHRDEDVASAPMTRSKGIPPTNRAGGISRIPGRFPTAQSENT